MYETPSAPNLGRGLAPIHFLRDTGGLPWVRPTGGCATQKWPCFPPGRQAAAEPTGVGVRDWQRRERFAGGGPDGTVYIGSMDRMLYALDGQIGKLKWEFDAGGKAAGYGGVSRMNMGSAGIMERASVSKENHNNLGAQAAGKTLSDLLIQLEELVENDRRLKSRWPGIDAERRAIETDRQLLAKANRELHQAVFTAGDALKAEIAARKTLHRRQSAALAMVFQVARTLGKLEFELLQSVLLQHLGTDATTIDSRAWAGLEGQISEAAAALPTQFAETKTLSLGSFLSARAGPVGQPWTTAWERYSYQPISSSESLAVQARRALAQTLWTLHLDKRGPLRAIQADIAATPLGNDKRPPNPLQGLLLVALQNFAELSLHQLDNGRAAISLDVLKQSRWLTPDGQFEYLPDS